MKEVLKQIKNNKELKSKLIKLKEECEAKGMTVSECVELLCEAAKAEEVQVDRKTMESILGVSTEEIKLQCTIVCQ